jgi:hypothetical protein
MSPAKTERPKQLSIEEVLKRKRPHVVIAEVGEMFWRFVAIGRERYTVLLASHPPTTDQQRESAALQRAAGVPLGQEVRRPWNLETFPPALIAASLVGMFDTEDAAKSLPTGSESYLDEEQAIDLWNSERFNTHELDQLFSAALVANTTTTSLVV